MKDFDITQINKDTKVIVFKIPNGYLYGNNHEAFTAYARVINDNLKKIGVTALFLDDSIQVSPLTDELLSTKKLKSLQ